MADSSEKLAEEIQKKRGSHEVVKAKLLTDERVIARVTDGIYRQPASALRELISNAYDADATEVFIDTDAPRFEKITVSDNGRGMRPDVLAYLLCHIGGSAKRTQRGAQIGVASQANAYLSPGGRRLIGKIGIGLFSVAQLTQTFQIITKVKGDAFRTVASVTLRTYTEDDLATSEGGEFESGLVNVWSERAEGKESHGTTIVLTDIRPQARDTLRSRNIWAGIEEARKTLGVEQDSVVPPEFHVGSVRPDTGTVIADSASLPWSKQDDPEKKFKKLVDAVWDQVGVRSPNPKLEDVCDYYLRMIWNLGLGAPLPYLEQHPFDIRFPAEVPIYELSNAPKGMATKLSGAKPKRPRDLASLGDGKQQDKFRVVVDGVQLARPLKFKNLPATDHALSHPIFFVGRCREPFDGVPREISSGPLGFEAYLVWTPKVAPREHRGVLVRINGSSGTLFDETFMKYQVSELTRLSQITCEIFVHEGLDGALNIDRESFNYAHPHFVFLSRWLHSALRQLATVQKKLASEVRVERREEAVRGAVGSLRNIVKREVAAATGDSAQNIPSVKFVSRNEIRDVGRRKDGVLLFAREAVLAPSAGAKPIPTKVRQATELRLQAIAQVLSAYGLLDDLSEAKRERLLRAIGEVLRTDLGE